jgi:hypothetical protein
MYSSTFFGRPHAHHQELNNCSGDLWFYLRNVVIAVLVVVIGPTTTNSSVVTTLVKREAATAVVELLMMGVWTPETC